MNYLRGAVNAISAPYQYYKDINPSTLTGAIDVIVVSRPRQSTDDTGNTLPANADNELVCSPFHVRFGKWQVLRPGDKKVNVFVNGSQVPFPMKIGEAGEAFFVFETDEDVPDDLVTSPLLEATKPGQSNAESQLAGRFGVTQGPDTKKEDDDASQEPDFLDLNAEAQEEPAASQSGGPQSNPHRGPGAESPEKPSLLTRTAQLGKTVIGAATETRQAEKDKLKDKSVADAISTVEQDERTFLAEKAMVARNATQRPQDFMETKGDEVLPVTQDVEGPEVVYTDDMVFDMEGYHSQQRDCLKDTETPRNEASSEQSSAGPSRSPTPSSSGVPFPTMRAVSEPPPEFGGITPPVPSLAVLTTPPTRSPSMSRMHATKERVGPHARLPTVSPLTDTEEYMWEWGNFPQRTPVRTMFSPTTNIGKGKGRMSDLSLDTNLGSNGDPSIITSPLALETGIESTEEATRFGEGGRLVLDRRDPTRFRVSIERRVVDFELSIVPGVSTSGRSRQGPLGGEDEVSDAQRFDRGKVDFDRFLLDDHIVAHDDLVLRWAGGMYITRADGSPLMDALVLWREAALKGKLGRSPSRSPSPESDSGQRTRLNDIEEETAQSDDERRRPNSASTDLSGTTVGSRSSDDTTARPSSSSWVRWWSRSRRMESTATRPDLKPMNTAPSGVQRSKTAALESLQPPVKRSSSAAPTSLRQSASFGRSGSTPSDLSETPSYEETKVVKERKQYAKTLRLTSDQLKSLDLKPGANSITFSLSATGAVACTARLFVWDHTDQVVISDIDGTITKSDALGHVFTMIGRDWTHLGVAKLYTDICRNGYKMLYLTSRAIGQADSTRDYLKGIKQNDYQLPEGPVIMSPDRLFTSLHREVIMRKPEVFKMAALRDIQKLFGSTAKNPFYAGFGNRITDALSYRSVNVPSSRIFTIDSTGEVKMELLELAGYKSSYIHMADLVDQMFPPINRKWAAEYTDFNYWKPPVQEFPLPDLSPPSPALSARSDTSNQSTLARLRQFSLGGGRQANNMKQFSLPPSAVGMPDKGRREDADREKHLRQMSSFERLSNTLAGFAQSASPISSPRSSTPTFIDSGDEDEDEDVDLEKQSRRRRRRRESMPGSLPGSDGSVSDDELQFGMDDDEGGQRNYDDYEDENEVAEETFDEDFLATGEMERVPFL